MLISSSVQRFCSRFSLPLAFSFVVFVIVLVVPAVVMVGLVAVVVVVVAWVVVAVHSAVWLS